MVQDKETYDLFGDLNLPVDFHDLKYTGSQTSIRRHAYSLVMSARFDWAMGLVILANAVTLGIQASIKADHPGENPLMPTSLHVFDHVFLLTYTIEAFLKLYGVGLVALKCNWIRIDLTLVILGYIDVITELVNVDSDAGVILAKLALLRMFRLARLARMIRLLTKFKALWLLSMGLINCMSTLLWTSVLIGCCLYVFAILGLEIIVPSPEKSEEYNAVAIEHFGDLFGAMLSLYQGLFMDGLCDIYRPLIYDSGPLTLIYFLAFVLICPVAMMNLVTAVIIDNAQMMSMEQQKWILEEKRVKSDNLKQLFAHLDVNGNGLLTLDEVIKAPEECQARLRDICKEETSASRVFELLDHNQSGSVGIKEFCESLMSEGSNGKPIEFFAILNQGSAILNSCHEMLGQVQSLKAEVSGRVNPVADSADGLGAGDPQENESLGCI